MADAISGESQSDGSYSFTIEATPDQVKAFYNQRLRSLGWQAFAEGQGETGSILLIYQKGTQILSISVLSSAKQPELVLVLIVP